MPSDRKEYYRAYYLKNLERRKECDRAYRLKNRERRNETSRRWRAENPERSKKNNREWYQRNRKPIREYQLFTRYGLTEAAYQEMAEGQDCCCKICRRPAQLERFAKLHVDHIKGTKVVRGLLCEGCNKGLGHFRESRLALAAAIEYLRVTAL